MEKEPPSVQYVRWDQSMQAALCQPSAFETAKLESTVGFSEISLNSAVL